VAAYRDLFDVHLKYVDYVRAKSYVVHQYVQNVAASGSGVEVEVRAILQSMLPERFRVTNGYVARAVDRTTEPTVSPHVDVLIVDTLVPHSLWLVDDTQGIEIVPQEALVAVLEVKRTLNEASLSRALEHLRTVVQGVGLMKDDPTGYLPGGLEVGAGLQAPYRGNPLIGIISLAAEGGFVTTPTETVRAAVAHLAADGSDPLLLDFVLSMSGIFVATADPGTSNYHPMLVRNGPAAQWAEASARTGRAGSVALAQGLGFILAYVTKTCGRSADMESYFFNTSIAG
jgi:hypothetical protein